MTEPGLTNGIPKDESYSEITITIKEEGLLTTIYLPVVAGFMMEGQYDPLELNLLNPNTAVLNQLLLAIKPLFSEGHGFMYTINKEIQD